MKKVGLVGGISWISTMDYDKFINEGVNARSVGLNFAECIFYSLNFGDVQSKGCIIPGCTEIPKLISQDDFTLLVFDTTKIHSQAIVDYILSS